MGQSLPPPANIELVSSYARLRGNEVELVLARPGPVHREEPKLVLRNKRRRVVASGALHSDTNHARLVMHVDRSVLTDGVWSLTLRIGRGPTPLNARLLVQGDRPLVLLWGAEAEPSRLPVPHAELHPPTLTQKVVRRLHR